MNATQAFVEAYRGGRNFLTPNIHQRWTTGEYHVELSSGVGIFSDKIWGVTFLTLDGKRPDEDISTCFGTEEAARAYVTEVTG